MITFEDFQKLEIKIGKVVAAEKVPETDKLLKLEVDFGLPGSETLTGNDISEGNSQSSTTRDIRTIVSGIAHAVEVDDIVGKEVPFITNLEPRTIRGIERQGMIMVAIDEEDKPVLMHPAKDVPAGAEVR